MPSDIDPQKDQDTMKTSIEEQISKSSSIKDSSHEKKQLENSDIVENSDVASEEEIIEICSCGHNRHHHLVTPNATYTAWATFWITMMGVSATPIRVDFICRVCKEKFDFEIDPERLKDFY